MVEGETLLVLLLRAPCQRLAPAVRDGHLRCNQKARFPQRAGRWHWPTPGMVYMGRQVVGSFLQSAPTSRQLVVLRRAWLSTFLLQVSTEPAAHGGLLEHVFRRK